MRSSSRSEKVRFLAIGAGNAIATYLLYLLLLRIVPYPVAYSLSYLAGIAISYVANSMLVFRAPMSRASAVRFPLVYVFQYAAGLALLAILVEFLAVPPWIAPWIVTAVLIPASYVLTRHVLVSRVKNATSDHQ